MPDTFAIRQRLQQCQTSIEKAEKLRKDLRRALRRLEPDVPRAFDMVRTITQLLHGVVVELRAVVATLAHEMPDTMTMSMLGAERTVASLDDFLADPEKYAEQSDISYAADPKSLESLTGHMQSLTLGARISVQRANSIARSSLATGLIGSA